MFLSFLGKARIVTSHEQRLVVTARQMAESGWPWGAKPVTVPRMQLQKDEHGSRLIPMSDSSITVNPWLVPVFNGELRLQKPPFPYWTTAVCLKIFGYEPAAARLPAALMGVASCLLVAGIFRRLYGRRDALIVAAIWISTYFVVTEFRKAMADPYLAFFCLAAISCWIEACWLERRLATICVLGVYLFVAIATLAKGPVALLHVVVAIGAFTTCYRLTPNTTWMTHFAGALLIPIVSLPWAAYVAGHVPGAIELWRFESVGEFSDNQRNARPIWYYFPQLILITLPWTGFAIAGIVASYRHRLRLFPLLWAIALIAVFSASHMKKNAYLLPIMPALALVAAQGVIHVAGNAKRRPDLVRLWIDAHLIGGVIAAVITVIASTGRCGSTLIHFLLSMLLLLIASVPLWFRKTRFMTWFGVQATAFALINLIFLAVPVASRQNEREALAIDNGPQIGPSEVVLHHRILVGSLQCVVESPGMLSHACFRMRTFFGTPASSEVLDSPRSLPTVPSRSKQWPTHRVPNSISHHERTLL